MNYIVIDIGGTSIKYGLVNECGRIAEKSKCDTRVSESENFILEDVDRIISMYRNNHKIDGVAISTAGVVDVKKGEIIYAGSTIPGYKGTNFKAYVKERFNLNCEVENDVNSAALGEAWLGLGKKYNSIFCITIGTGIGGAFIINGSIVSGAANTAGEVGYMNLNGVEIQEIASTKALVEAVSKRNNFTKGDINGKTIFNEAKNGNLICIEEIDRIIDKIVDLILNINYVVNPESFVLGGGIMEQSKYIRPILLEKISKKDKGNFLRNTDINFATLGNDAGMIGALYNYLIKNKC